MSDRRETPRAPIGAVPESVAASPDRRAQPTEQREAPRASPERRYDGDPQKLVRQPRLSDYDRPHPLYAVWEITLRCDLGCRHCGSRAGKARPDELDTAGCLDVVRELDELGIREVTLIGGEAYLRDDWHLIAAEITRRGMRCGITTGARNLTPARVEQAVEAGITQISVSIDGLQNTHDAQRNARGSWRAAVAGAERIASSPIQLTVNTQINRLSLPELPALAQLLGDLGARAWQVQLTVPMGNGADRPDLLLQPFELLELFPLLVWIDQHRLRPREIQLFPGNNIGYFGPFEKQLRYGGDRGAHWSGCSAGKWCLGLEADGKIKGCPSLPSDSYTGGYLGRDPLQSVVAHSEPLRRLRERTVDDLWGFCRDCYYADICRGGCSWTTHCLLGRPGNNPYCIHRATQLEARGLQERVIKVAAAPGKPFDHGRFELRSEPVEIEPKEATLCGIPLARCLELTPDTPSIWDDEQLRNVLRPNSNGETTDGGSRRAHTR